MKQEIIENLKRLYISLPEKVVDDYKDILFEAIAIILESSSPPLSEGEIKKLATEFGEYHTSQGDDPEFNKVLGELASIPAKDVIKWMCNIRLLPTQEPINNVSEGEIEKLAIEYHSNHSSQPISAAWSSQPVGIGHAFTWLLSKLSTQETNSSKISSSSETPQEPNTNISAKDVENIIHTYLDFRTDDLKSDVSEIIKKVVSTLPSQETGKQIDRRIFMSQCDDIIHDYSNDPLPKEERVAMQHMRSELYRIYLITKYISPPPNAETK